MQSHGAISRERFKKLTLDLEGNNVIARFVHSVRRVYLTICPVDWYPCLQKVQALDMSSKEKFAMPTDLLELR